MIQRVCGLSVCWVRGGKSQGWEREGFNGARRMTLPLCEAVRFINFRRVIIRPVLDTRAQRLLSRQRPPRMLIETFLYAFDVSTASIYAFFRKTIHAISCTATGLEVFLADVFLHLAVLHVDS